MKLILSATILGFVNAQSIFDFLGSGDNSGDYEEIDNAWRESCDIFCDGVCVMEAEICDGKKHCESGEDEQSCHTEEEVFNSNNKSKSNKNKLPTATARPQPPGGFRGRFPGPGYAPQESMYYELDERKFNSFERKNRKLVQFVTGAQKNIRMEQMMKMMYYMTEGQMSAANFMEYGCHCSVNAVGHGIQQDNIDSLCSANAGCRKCAMADFNCDENSSYLVSGSVQGDVDGLGCTINRPGTCARALCECDLEMLKKFVLEKSSFDENLQGINGFDKTNSCSAASISSRSFGSSFQSNNNYSSDADNLQCCGSYPHRFPYNANSRSCCNGATFHTERYECCDLFITPIGMC